MLVVSFKLQIETVTLVVLLEVVSWRKIESKQIRDKNEAVKVVENIAPYFQQAAYATIKNHNNRSESSFRESYQRLVTTPRHWIYYQDKFCI